MTMTTKLKLVESAIQAENEVEGKVGIFAFFQCLNTPTFK